jgi:hypothetical protein
VGVKYKRRIQHRCGKKVKGQEEDQDAEPKELPKPSEDQERATAAGAKPILINDPKVKKLLKAGSLGHLN